MMLRSFLLFLVSRRNSSVLRRLRPLAGCVVLAEASGQRRDSGAAESPAICGRVDSSKREKKSIGRSSASHFFFHFFVVLLVGHAWHRRVILFGRRCFHDCWLGLSAANHCAAKQAAENHGQPVKSTDHKNHLCMSLNCVSRGRIAATQRLILSHHQGARSCQLFQGLILCDQHSFEVSVNSC